jgi:hypothetical protein
MGLKRRIQKLDGGGCHYSPDDCPAPQQVFLRHREGEPEPPTPPDAPRCRLCGAIHVLVIEEVIVNDHAEAVDCLARIRGEEEGWTA